MLHLALIWHLCHCPTHTQVTEHLRRELMAKAERIAMLEVELDTVSHHGCESSW